MCHPHRPAAAESPAHCGPQDQAPHRGSLPAALVQKPADTLGGPGSVTGTFRSRAWPGSAPSVEALGGGQGLRRAGGLLGVCYGLNCTPICTLKFEVPQNVSLFGNGSLPMSK